MSIFQRTFIVLNKIADENCENGCHFVYKCCQKWRKSLNASILQVHRFCISWQNSASILELSHQFCRFSHQFCISLHHFLEFLHHFWVLYKFWNFRITFVNSCIIFVNVYIYVEFNINIVKFCINFVESEINFVEFSKFASKNFRIQNWNCKLVPISQTIHFKPKTLHLIEP